VESKRKGALFTGPVDSTRLSHESVGKWNPGLQETEKKLRLPGVHPVLKFEAKLVYMTEWTLASF
jgi:hypothetical protein